MPEKKGVQPREEARWALYDWKFTTCVRLGVNRQALRAVNSENPMLFSMGLMQEAISLLTTLLSMTEFLHPISGIGEITHLCGAR